MFERFKNALRGAAPSAQLKDALTPLRAEAAQLYEAALAYVHSGASPEILVSLEQAKNPQVDDLLMAPGRIRGWVHTKDAAIKALQAIGLKTDDVRKSRHAFYCSAAEPDQFVRMGKLLAAASVDVNRTVEGVPTWLTALVNDVVATCQGGHNPTILTDRLPTWRPEFIAAIAAADEVLDPDVTTILAICQHSPESWYPQLTPRNLPGMDAFLAARGAQLTPKLVGRLNAEARTYLADRAEHLPEVGLALAPVTAALCVDSAKGVRTTALRALATLPPATRAEVLPPVLATATAARAGELVELLGRDEAGAALLTDAVAGGARIGGLVEQAAQRRGVLTTEAAGTPIEVPPFEPLPDTPAGAAVLAELRRAAGGDAAGQRKRFVSTALSRATPADLEEIVRVANGEATSAKLLKRHSAWWIAEAAPSLTLFQLLRLWKAGKNGWYQGAVTRYADADTDLRVLADAIERVGIAIDPADLVDNPVSPAAAWPYFADHLDVLERWLASSTAEITRALSVLAEFPSLPPSVLPKVAAVALGDSRTNRPLAQAALRGHPAAQQLAAQGLASGRGEVRAAAADWLAAEGDPAAISTLRAALAKEKREAARAALLAALETLGDDISTDLAPDVLSAEAARGLRAKPPASLAWFDPATIPAAHWADGATVDPAVLRWWFVLAVKLKDPDGSGLLDLYLSRLAPADAAAVGRHALRSWIARDTVHPSEEESRAHAASAGPQRWRNAQDNLRHMRGNPTYQSYMRWIEEEAALTVEDHIAREYRLHQAIYVGTATADKGMLALTTRVPGIELANAVQGYIRDHGARRAQVEYLITTLYGNGDPAAVQLLLSISRRFKQAGNQAKALEFVQRIAEARGWSAEELADRTIPTAGFVEDRLLHLDFGGREFLGRVGAKASIELSDANGKPVKTLPAPRGGDDEELAAEAKKQLATSRKELKAVLALQTSRLYEAMCVQRTWPVADWTAFLADHPLVSQLITRLVWLENPGPDQRAFRPAEDGELIDADDEPFELAAGARVGLAHRVLLDEAVVAAWRQHLVDYRVEPLFGQLDTTVPNVPDGATELHDLRGHLTDTFRFRGVATKRGYSRGAAEDGGWFTEYTKAFTSAGLVARITFTGSVLPEENIACATETLAFVRRNREIRLDAVPPVLLAECYADYAALAALGPYDPDYERKAGL